MQQPPVGIHFTHSGVYMSVLLSQCVLPSPSPSSVSTRPFSVPQQARWVGGKMGGSAPSQGPASSSVLWDLSMCLVWAQEMEGKVGKGDAHHAWTRCWWIAIYLINPHEVVSGSLIARRGPATHHLEAALCGVGVGSSMQGRTLPVGEAAFWGPLGGDKPLCCKLWGTTVLRLHLTVVQTFHGLLGLWCFGGGRLFKGLRFCHFSCVFSPLFSGPFMFYSV